MTTDQNRWTRKERGRLSLSLHVISLLYGTYSHSELTQFPRANRSDGEDETSIPKGGRVQHAHHKFQAYLFS